MEGAVCALDAALDTVSEPVMAVSIGVGSCDVAVEWWGSGLERRAWGFFCSAVGQAGNEHHRVRCAGGCFESGGGMVVVAVNNIDSTDGGCAGIVSGDVVDSSGDGVAVGSSRGVV